MSSAAEHLMFRLCREAASSRSMWLVQILVSSLPRLSIARTHESVVYRKGMGGKSSVVRVRQREIYSAGGILR